jgi:hypothetical protein
MVRPQAHVRDVDAPGIRAEPREQALPRITMFTIHSK